ncbi:PorV/PorQ family protein [Membranihabitans maritimus]|uniref:putative type IX sorting system protein PorV2 n=1 Tax=Membranihabitans maritimus TaxID=2904244 RepID=UPI001F3308B3|nr:PorV/PorQ family protein [Membranihabitans maritimus]
MRFGILFIVVYLVLGFQEGKGQQIYGNNFLNIGVGARSLGMGKAVVATEKSVQSAYWNPANLSTWDGPMQLSAMHAVWFAGVVNYDYLGSAFSLGSDGKSYGGISLIRMGVDDIPNTLQLFDADGRINYSNIRSFTVADYAGLITYSTQLGDSPWRVGGNVKIIRRVYGSFAKAWGGGLDAAASYSGERFHFGFVVRDISTTTNSWSYQFTDSEIEILQQLGNVVPESAREVIRPSVSTGIAQEFGWSEDMNFTLALDADITFDGVRNTLVASETMSIEPHVGLEMNSRDVLFLRAGIASVQKRKKINNPESDEYFIQPNMGIGLRLGRVNINYALAFLNEDDSKSSLSHVFSAMYTLKGREEGGDGNN